MNSRYKKTPEVIASVKTIDKSGDESFIGDLVAGIQVVTSDDTAIAQLDLRSAKTGNNTVIEIELSELVAAISLATLHSERE